MKKLICLLTVLSLLTALLAGCTDEPAEIATMEPTVPETAQTTVPLREGTVQVATVDEFLAALDSNTSIYLTEGEYVLSQASDYGLLTDNPAYYWEDMGDGYQLKLNRLHDLTIEGAGLEVSRIVTDPRLANVFSLDGCQNIRISNLTMGHTEGAEMCSGGVISLYDCKNVGLQSLGLFGCGVTGVQTYYSENIGIQDCQIYECSMNGLDLQDSSGIQILRSDFYSIGTSKSPAMEILRIGGCESVRIEDCSFSENNVMNLLCMGYSQEILLKNCEMRANKAIAGGFELMDCSPVFDGCSLEGNDLRRWYSSGGTAVNADGDPLTEDELPPIYIPEPAAPDKLETVTVTTVDEFLGAIGSNREIILKGDVFNLSTASENAAGCGENWFWEDPFDGPQLVITGVSNLIIRGDGTDRTQVNIYAVPRYANVLTFRGCSNITLSGFTAGHTEEPGYCTGGVLNFMDCTNVTVDDCGLFGCGTLGVYGNLCTNIAVLNCDIYECSYGGIQFYVVENINIAGNTFWDLGGPEVMIESCENVSCDLPLYDQPEE